MKQKRSLHLERFESRRLLANDAFSSLDAGTLNAEGEQGATVRFTHQLLDAQRQVLDVNEVEVGDFFYWRTFVEDTREVGNQGVNAAFIDIAFDNADVFDIAVGEIQSLRFFVDQLDRTATDSSFSLTFQGENTAPIALFASGELKADVDVAESIQNSIEALPGVGVGNVLVDVDFQATAEDRQNGLDRYSFEIRFLNTLAGQDVALLNLDAANVGVNPGQSFNFEITEELVGDATSPEAQAESVIYDGDYKSLTGAEIQESRLNDVGAVDQNIPVANSESAKLLFTIPMIATKPGIVNFTPEYADNAPFTDVITVVTIVPPSMIAFGDPLTLKVSGPPSNITLDKQSIDENSPFGTLVGRFSSVPDLGEEHTYALIAGAGDADNALFRIRDDQLLIGENLDFEENATRSIRVQTTDRDGQSFSRSFMIDILDINESPTDVQLSNLSIIENLPADTIVGELSTIDPDVSDDFVYSITGDSAANEMFAISGNTLVSANSFDHEERGQWELTIRSTDKAGLFTESNFLITVDDANDAPSDLLLTNNSLEENLPVGTFVGQFQPTDQDAVDEFVFTLVAGEGDDDNALFSIETDRLLSNEILDFESKSSHRIRVAVEDLAGAVFERILEIEVIDVDENDVNGDSFVSPIDALMVINFLNSNDTGDLGPEDNLRLDINGDRLVTPIDALLVINFLNNNADGEGENDLRTEAPMGFGATWLEVAVPDIHFPVDDLEKSTSWAETEFGRRRLLHPWG